MSKVEVVLESDDGIIAIALKLYLDYIEKMEGSPELYDRVLELYHQYRDADE